MSFYLYGLYGTETLQNEHCALQLSNRDGREMSAQQMSDMDPNPASNLSQDLTPNQSPCQDISSLHQLRSVIGPLP
jgi:hypothetical protein